MKLEQMLQSFAEWKQDITTTDSFLKAESQFHREADGEAIAMYTKEVYSGTQFRGVHPYYLESRSDFQRIDAIYVQVANAVWERRDFTCERGIIKQHEYVFIKALS